MQNTKTGRAWHATILSRQYILLCAREAGSPVSANRQMDKTTLPFSLLNLFLDQNRFLLLHQDIMTC